MHFHLLAYDATDEGTLERRMAVREAHLAYVQATKDSGNILMGAALLDEDGKMIGSAQVLDFPSQDAVEAWLAEEPYVKNNVWEEVTVTPCSVGPAFLKKPMS